VALHSPRALRRLLWAPGEIGLARAYVSGDLDFEGDLYDALVTLGLPDRDDPGGFRLTRGELLAALRVAVGLEAAGPPPPPPPEEARLGGRRHSLRRDRLAVTHHYEAGPARARIWRRYMAGSALAFERGRLGVNQCSRWPPGRAGTRGCPCPGWGAVGSASARVA